MQWKILSHIVLAFLICQKPKLSKENMSLLVEANLTKEKKPLIAESLYKKVLTETKDSGIQKLCYTSLYEIYFSQRDYKKAVEIWEKYKNLYQDTLPYLGIAMLRAGKFESILENPYFPDNLRAQAAESLRKFDEAIKFYKNLDQIFLKDLPLTLFKLYLELGELDSAVTYAKKVKELPDNAKLKLAKIYEEKKLFEKGEKIIKSIKNTKKRFWTLAHFYQRRGREKEAKRIFLTILRKFPSSEEAIQALKHVELKEPHDFYYAGIALKNRYPEKAINYFKSASKSIEIKHRCLYQIASIKIKLGRYREAEQIIKKLNNEYAWMLGYQLAVLKKDENEALKYLEKVIRKGRNTKILTKAYSEKGNILQRKENWEKALALYHEGYRRFKTSDFKRKIIVISSMLAKEEEIKQFISYPSKDYELFYLYKATGDTSYAEELFQKFPLSFYTLFVKQRVKVDTLSTREWIIKNFGEKVITREKEELIDSIKAFAEAGLIEFIEKSFEKFKNDPYISFRIAKLYDETGYDNLSIKWAERLKSMAKKKGIMTLPEEVLRLLYPVKYLFFIKGTSQDPSLILSLIRQESWFNPYAVSSANARGLCQLLFSTAKDLKPDVEIDSLFNPELSITLGAQYLAIQQKRFDHPWEFIGAYNAGPGRVQKWVTYLPRNEYFIDLIPFRETREFTKNVIKGRIIYQYLLRD